MVTNMSITRAVLTHEMVLETMIDFLEEDTRALTCHAV